MPTCHWRVTLHSGCAPGVSVCPQTLRGTALECRSDRVLLLSLLLLGSPSFKNPLTFLSTKGAPPPHSHPQLASPRHWGREHQQHSPPPLLPNPHAGSFCGSRVNQNTPLKPIISTPCFPPHPLLTPHFKGHPISRALSCQPNRTYMYSLIHF